MRFKGYDITKTDDGSICIVSKIGAVAVRTGSTQPRLIPEEILYYLARSILESPAPEDSGEWKVVDWSNGKIALQSNDFTFDCALIVDGNFSSEEEKKLYAAKLAAKLNAV